MIRIACIVLLAILCVEVTHSKPSVLEIARALRTLGLLDELEHGLERDARQTGNTEADFEAKWLEAEQALIRLGGYKADISQIKSSHFE